MFPVHREPAVVPGDAGTVHVGDTDKHRKSKREVLWSKIRKSCPCNSNVDTGKRYQVPKERTEKLAPGKASLLVNSFMLSQF